MRIPLPPEREDVSDDDAEAVHDRTKKKHRLLKGWRMGDAPVLQQRIQQTPAIYGSSTTQPARGAPKAQAPM